MTDRLQDVFISHASADKERYVLPLSRAMAHERITFWLDSAEIRWGDNILMQINAGLQQTRFMLLCLSKAFLERPWPESEMSAALAIQNSSGVKKVLPLILNSSEEVLHAYPIIHGLAYRQFGSDATDVAREIAAIIKPIGQERRYTLLYFESRHTGNVSNIEVPNRASVEWLGVTAAERLGVLRSADVGSFERFVIRWIPVESSLLDVWESIPQRIKLDAWGVFKAKNDDAQHLRIDGLDGVYQKNWLADIEQKLKESNATVTGHKDDRIADFTVNDGDTFYLSAVQDRPPVYASG
jgi:hypothetical protein